MRTTKKTTKKTRKTEVVKPTWVMNKTRPTLIPVTCPGCDKPVLLVGPLACPKCEVAMAVAAELVEHLAKLGADLICPNCQDGFPVDFDFEEAVGVAGRA